MISRRELFQCLLGMSASAVAGCVPRTLPPEGELLAPDLALGHRLRDGFLPQPTADAWRRQPVVIVGGGIAGLSAAWRLQQAGWHDFVVLELEDQPGGTSLSGKRGPWTFPWGAHYITTPLPENRTLLLLLQQMGVVEGVSDNGHPRIAEQYLCREPEERLFFQGQWQEGVFPSLGASDEEKEQLQAFRAELARLAQQTDRQGRRMFAIPLAHGGDHPSVRELDQISMADWMARQGWDSPRLRWYVDYACRDDYGLTASRTSAWAGVLYFAARLRQQATESQDVITWPAGNGEIVNFLARACGQRLRQGEAVCRITPHTTGGAEVVVWNKKLQQAYGYHTEHVVFAAPQFLAPVLIDQFSERTGRHARDFHYGSWMTANVHLRQRPRESGFPLSWDNVIHDSKSLGYVVATHQTGHDHGPTIWTWYYPFAEERPALSRQQLLQLTWDDWADVVLQDLSVPHPDLRSLVTRVDIMRWGHAMIQPYPGFMSSESRARAALPDQCIHFAHTDLSGIALLEEAFYQGVRAADEILQELGTNPPPDDANAERRT